MIELASRNEFPEHKISYGARCQNTKLQKVLVYARKYQQQRLNTRQSLPFSLTMYVLFSKSVE